MTRSGGGSLEKWSGGVGMWGEFRRRPPTGLLPLSISSSICLCMFVQIGDQISRPTASKS